MTDVELPISRQRVDEIHEIALKRYGGDSGSLHGDGCIDGSLGNAWTAVQYINKRAEEDPVLFAIYAFIYLLRAHCYVDGNKRVAWFTLAEGLKLHGLTLDASEDAAVQFCLDCEAGKYEDAEIRNWIVERVTAL